MKSARRLGLLAALATCVLSAAPALAAEQSSAWNLGVVYTADVAGAVAGDATHAGRVLDNLDVTLDGDLEKAFGWRGANLHLYVLNNSGGRPNDIVATLQGVDNIEVAHARLRLYELWLEQSFVDGRASVRAGLYDLNSEFYSTDASSLLLAPPFGIGSEFSATGPNGPSIFPLTSLTLRLKAGGETGAYAQGAVLAADAGTLSGPEDASLGLNDGVIVIGEAGFRGRIRAALGGWTYTQKQDQLHATAPDGEPLRAHAYGGYLLAEGDLWRGVDERSVSAFLRLGASDAKTTPFKGGWQAGLLAEGLLPGRPHSAASIGLQQAYLAGQERRAARAAGGDPATAESGVEVTFSDTFGRLSVQPDLQLLHHPGGDRERDLALIAALRLTLVLH